MQLCVGDKKAKNARAEFDAVRSSGGDSRFLPQEWHKCDDPSLPIIGGESPCQSENERSEFFTARTKV